LSIEHWRNEIDQIDEQLVRLLNERSKCAIELGRIKRELGLAIYSPDREKQVIQHVTSVNGGPHVECNESTLKVDIIEQ
jgi:chorismate mutase